MGPSWWYSKQNSFLQCPLHSRRPESWLLHFGCSPLLRPQCLGPCTCLGTLRWGSWLPPSRCWALRLSGEWTSRWKISLLNESKCILQVSVTTYDLPMAAFPQICTLRSGFLVDLLSTWSLALSLSRCSFLSSTSQGFHSLPSKEDCSVLKRNNTAVVNPTYFN